MTNNFDGSGPSGWQGGRAGDGGRGRLGFEDDLMQYSGSGNVAAGGGEARSYFS